VSSPTGCGFAFAAVRIILMRMLAGWRRLSARFGRTSGRVRLSGLIIGGGTLSRGYDVRKIARGRQLARETELRCARLQVCGFGKRAHPRLHPRPQPSCPSLRGDYASACRPKGPTVNSQGCKPLVWNSLHASKPQRGESSLATSVAPLRASDRKSIYQGLTPLPIACRRFAAKSRASRCIIPAEGREPNQRTNSCSSSRTRCAHIIAQWSMLTPSREHATRRPLRQNSRPQRGQLQRDFSSGSFCPNRCGRPARRGWC
jgi:hypothetical protein